MNCKPIDFLIKSKPNIPHPQNSILIKPLVFNQKHPLSIIELSVFCDHHRQLISCDLEVSLMDDFTLFKMLKIIVVVRVEHDIFRSVHFLYFRVQKFVDKLVLCFFFIPSVCLSSQFFFNNPFEKLMELFFFRFLDYSKLNHAVKLRHKCTVI